MIKIYFLQNSVSGKMYVGQTKQPLKKRFNDHFRKDSNCTYLKNSLNKYGKKSFKIIELDIAFDQSQADALEKFWIKELNSLAPNGYNLQIGGTGYKSDTKSDNLSKALLGKSNTKARKSVICLDTLEIYPSVTAAAKSINVSTGNMSDHLKNRRYFLKKQRYSYHVDGKYETFEIKDKSIALRDRALKQFSSQEAKDALARKNGSKEFSVYKDGIFLKDYVSKRGCELDIGIASSSIRRCLNGEYKQCKGYTFKYKEES